MLTVIQYYIIIKKTKTSRKDLKKEGKIMTANISDLQCIASNLKAGGWTSKDAKEIQLEYNLCDDEVNVIVEIMEEMEK